MEDGFSPVEVTDAIKNGTIIMYLLSDAGQKQQWDVVKPLLTPGKTLYFSHGFSITYQDVTGTFFVSYSPHNAKNKTVTVHSSKQAFLKNMVCRYGNVKKILCLFRRASTSSRW